MSERLLTAAELDELFAPGVVQALERLVDERVRAALAERDGIAKRWLTVGETGAYLGCGSQAVYVPRPTRLSRHGPGPAPRRGAACVAARPRT